MTNEEMAARVEELSERVGVLSAALLELLSDREEQAMIKAATIFKNPREKAVDIIGFTVRPWLMIATPAAAKAVRALPLDAVLADLALACGASTKGVEMADVARKYAVTWEEIGVSPEGSVRADSMAKLPKWKRPL